MKWIWIAVLIVVGIVTAIFAGEYLTTGIGHLPSWVPGNHPGTRGHMYKRGYVAGFVTVAAFGGAGWLIFKHMQAAKSDAGTGS